MTQLSQYRECEWAEMASGICADMPFIWRHLEAGAEKMDGSYRVEPVSVPHRDGGRALGIAIAAA